MKTAALSLLLAASATSANPLKSRTDGIQGFDISSYQINVDFSGAYDAGAPFLMIKATEGTTYIDSSFSNHYDGATDAGLIRGAYHFAHPDSSSGATQAEYFLAHGGDWTNDGQTLHGMLDIEYDPSGSTCYGLSPSDMISWVKDFGETYHSKAGRYPMIYTTADWWDTCTGGSAAFSTDYPLVLAQYASSISTVPGGWPYQSFWQNSDSYSYGGDSDIWNGNEDSLKAFAKGS
ncbi:hypothetical protein PENDEC_c007G06980 [Penicillium decumbens]|uniref:N,O-diacetylmuramidase n=1 Tax=Penicillium decumbens TaxID=69771 RepID=A0A1V6PE68_PENDC|nr:hypothetical protein PENDEC_c007G06980 [Penicillium decumbens]